MRPSVAIALLNAIGTSKTPRTESAIAEAMGPQRPHDAVLSQQLNELERAKMIERSLGGGRNWTLTAKGVATALGGETEFAQQSAGSPAATNAPSSGVRECACCHQKLPEEAFRKNSASGWCKVCTAAARGGRPKIPQAEPPPLDPVVPRVKPESFRLLREVRYFIEVTYEDGCVERVACDHPQILAMQTTTDV